MSKRNVYKGHRYVPKIMGEWNQEETYEGLSIVTNKGTSFTSKKRVPIGIDILDEEYWVVTGNYNAQVENYRQEVREFDNRISDNETGIEKTNTQLEQFSTRMKQLVIYVDDFGAVGDGETDDTQAIQDALDYASNIGAMVKFKKELYMVDALISLNVPSQSVIDFTNTTIKALPNSEHRYNVIHVSNVENIHLINPTIVGDRDEHITSPAYKPENVDGFGGEWGMGLRIESSKNIHVYNIDVSKCWGDGININDPVETPITEKVYFYGVSKSYDNRRQGLSVISGKDVYFERLEVKDIYGTKPMRAVDFEPDTVTNKGIENFRIDYLKGENCSAVLEFVPREMVHDISIGHVESINCWDPQIRFANRRYVNKFDDKITIESLSIDYLEDKTPLFMEQWFNELCPMIDIKHLNIDKWVNTKSSNGDERMNYGYVFLRNRVKNEHYDVPTEYFDVGGINLHDVMVNDFTDTTTYNRFNPFITKNSLAHNSDMYSVDNVKIKASEINPLRYFNEIWNYIEMDIKNVDIFDYNDPDIPALNTAIELTTQNITDELFTVNRDEFYTIKHYRFTNNTGVLQGLPTQRGFLTVYNNANEKMLIFRSMSDVPLNAVMQIRRYKADKSDYIPKEDWTTIKLIDIE